MLLHLSNCFEIATVFFDCLQDRSQLFEGRKLQTARHCIKYKIFYYICLCFLFYLYGYVCDFTLLILRMIYFMYCILWFCIKSKRNIPTYSIQLSKNDLRENLCNS